MTLVGFLCDVQLAGRLMLSRHARPHPDPRLQILYNLQLFSPHSDLTLTSDKAGGTSQFVRSVYRDGELFLHLLNLSNKGPRFRYRLLRLSFW